MAGHVAIEMDNLVYLRAIDKEIIHRAPGQRREAHQEGKSVIHFRFRCRIPHHGVAFAGNQKWNGNIGVVLRKLDCAAAIVEHPALVLA